MTTLSDYLLTSDMCSVNWNDMSVIIAVVQRLSTVLLIISSDVHVELSDTFLYGY